LIALYTERVQIACELPGLLFKLCERGFGDQIN
jgi:hypothetical protein